MAKTNTAPPRGMRDLLPAQVELRDFATTKILETYRRFGFTRIETPVVEHIELLLSSGGGENEKLIYKVLKRGAKLDLASARSEDDLVDFGLRYDLTVPLARYYSHHRAELPAPFKAIQIGPVWRADRPQKGRYRQFTQCDIDILDEPGIVAEIELIGATTAALSALGLSGFTVRINDRRLLTAMAAGCGFAPDAVGGVFIALDKLDKVGIDGVVDELRGAGHADAAVTKLTDVLRRSGDASDPLAALTEGLDGVDEPVESLGAIRSALEESDGASGRLVFDPTLVRGMGYYTGTIFEIGVDEHSFSIAGGGRYDRMIGGMTGKDVPACGFSIGFERVVLMLEERASRPERDRPLVALLYDRSAALAPVFVAASRLRESGRAVSVVPRRKNVRQQLSELAAQGFDGFASFEPGTEPPGTEPEVRPLQDRDG